MNELSFYRDEEGTPRARAETEEIRVLANFLESDLQDDIITTRELFSRIEGGLEEHDEPVEFTGNRHAVTFTSDTVIISSHIEEDNSSAMLEPHQVETALKGWIAFIDS